MLNNYSVVAENDGVIIGFGSTNTKGYFDLLYTHKDYQGIGVATFIADDIENYNYHKGIRIITVESSVTAKPFFEKRGYLIVEKQNVEKRNQIFINFKMQKSLLKKVPLK